jgi:hypothetical protein
MVKVEATLMRSSWAAGAGASTKPDGFELGAEALVDMLLLSEASAFVGKFTSSFFRAALEIAGGRCQCVPPDVSLDSSWCFGQGLVTRVGLAVGHREKFMC